MNSLFLSIYFKELSKVRIPVEPSSFITFKLEVFKGDTFDPTCVLDNTWRGLVRKENRLFRSSKG